MIENTDTEMLLQHCDALWPDIDSRHRICIELDLTAASARPPAEGHEGAPPAPPRQASGSRFVAMVKPKFTTCSFEPPADCIARTSSFPSIHIFAHTNPPPNTPQRHPAAHNGRLRGPQVRGLGENWYAAFQAALPLLLTRRRTWLLWHHPQGPAHIRWSGMFTIWLQQTVMRMF
jgi:hypothetical protein